MKKNWTIIGIMSGTSLDGIDLACCKFSEDDGKWSYQVQGAETIPYSGFWVERLRNVENASAFEYVRTDLEYGHLIGKVCRKFILDHGITPDFISSHGHTVFHQPDKMITSQIGHGSAITAETGFPVVCDFRTTDVALHGQGAPLVPIGDRLLFSDYNYCLNLGGFANISYEKEGKRIAFDVCPVNIVLNHFSMIAGYAFDFNGDLARSGRTNPELLSRLNSLAYYHQGPPKSLGKEWVISEVFPLMESFKIPVEDQLSTMCSHVAAQVSGAVQTSEHKKILVTGGGALNGFLMEEIKKENKTKIIIPDKGTIEFKEALVFAFLGLLRWTNQVNILSSVTGADRDSIGGSVFAGQ